MDDNKPCESISSLNPERLLAIEKEIAKLFSKYKKEEIGYCLMKHQIKLMEKPTESLEITKMATELKTVR